MPEQNIIHYTMKTGLGLSGSPVLVCKDNWEQKVVGIHTHRGADRSHNSGLYFSAEVIRILKEWVGKMEEKWQLEPRRIF